MKKQSLLLFLGTLLIYLAFLPPGIYSIDGYSMLAVADSLVTHHNMTVPAGSGMVGKDGQTYSLWYPLQSVLAVPVVAAAVKASSVTHLPLHYVESFSVTILPALYTALTVPLVYLISMSLGSLEIGAWLAAITYGFGTMALAYTRDFYADPLVALLFALGILLAFRQNASWVIVLVTALAVLAKPTGIILGPVLSAYLFLKTRNFRFSLLPGLGSAIGLATYFLYNFYRFGDFRTFGQPWAFSLGNVPQGLAGLLISPGAGLLWFCPCVVLAVAALWQIRTRRLEAWTIAALAASSLLLHSLWLAWNGGSSWGPRLLLPVLPGLVALTGVFGNGGRKLLAMSALLGFFLTAPNLVASYKRSYAEAGEHGVSYAELMWQPRRSLLLNGWPAAVRQIQDARQSDVRELFAQRTGIPASTIATSRALRIVEVWWWVLPVVNISRVWGMLISGLLTVSGIWLLALGRLRSIQVTDPNGLSPMGNRGPGTETFSNKLSAEL
jgi:hypothetical protein